MRDQKNGHTVINFDWVYLGVFSGYWSITILCLLVLSQLSAFASNFLVTQIHFNAQPLHCYLSKALLCQSFDFRFILNFIRSCNLLVSTDTGIVVLYSTWLTNKCWKSMGAFGYMYYLVWAFSSRIVYSIFHEPLDYFPKTVTLSNTGKKRRERKRNERGTKEEGKRNELGQQAGRASLT